MFLLVLGIVLAFKNTQKKCLGTCYPNTKNGKRVVVGLMSALVCM
jgi:hypothetical protein